MVYDFSLYLHYTLLLLIPFSFIKIEITELIFTLHFATINTYNENNNLIALFQFTLHFATINTINE